MQDGWKSVEVILPDDLPDREVLDQIRARIRFNAAEGGEFVARIRIDAGQPHSQGLRRWLAAYLPGPPGAFPPVGSELLPRQPQRPGVAADDG